MYNTFSVLMSVYSKEKPEYLDEALNSIFAQTLLTNDLVLVCDGPLTEELDNIILKYTKKYEDILNVVRLEKNGGLGNALNIGLNLCKNEIVARMDSDDISLPNRFQRQIEIFQLNPEIDLVGSNVTEFNETMEKVISQKAVPEKSNEIIKYMKKRNPFNHMSVVYKKSSVIAAGNYEDCPYFEDYYLWCKMAMNNCKFYNVQENLINVRAGKNMINRRGGRIYNQSIINFQKKIKQKKFIGSLRFIINIFERLLISNMPNNLRYTFYKKILRKEK